ncbi:MAG: citrate/2-methylcitrate synthase [Candidatus Sulfotelmatobacter sp.]
MSSVTTNHPPKGLEGVVATTSKICYIDGDRGVLAYRGIDIHELAHQSNFEETCYLLWFGKLPTRLELRQLHDRLAEERKLDASIITLLRNAPRHALPMDVLRTAVSALSFYDAQEKNNDCQANIDKAIRITSQIAMIVATYDRIRKGNPVVEPDRSMITKTSAPWDRLGRASFRYLRKIPTWKPTFHGGNGSIPQEGVSEMLNG